jgi:hypothetical protein
VLCAAALAVWLFLRYRPSAGRHVFPLIGALMVGDLLLFGHGKRILQDPALYYPEIPALRQVASATPGRILGIDCMPANNAQAVGLSDVRGFDSIDPDRWTELLLSVSSTKRPDFYYTALQRFPTPWKYLPPDGITFSPILDMLSVRYAIFRGLPAAGIEPRFKSLDYYVLENRSALPRVYVPSRVEADSSAGVLGKLDLPDFDARRIAYVETPLSLPAIIHGTARIEEETPVRIVVDARMETPGLLVLADRWDVGWQAYVDGQRAPILRANYAIRGVVLPAGPSRVEFRYESKMLQLGNRLAAGAIAILLGWTALAFWRRRKSDHDAAAMTDHA